jgi:AraC family transcriptional regulator
MDYIEAHIDDDLALGDVSAVTAYSAYHFGRLFYYIADMPLSEYIRRRKLSLAAMALQSGDAKVIDLALRYGYDSADSFARAFARQHGVTPSAARQAGVRLTIFPPLTFQITIKGVQAMNWRIEEKEAFEVFGIEMMIKNVLDPDETGEITAFWKECHANGSIQRLIAQGGRSDLMGFGAYVEEQAEECPFMICLVADPGRDTSGFQVWSVPAASWAVFRSDEFDENPHSGEPHKELHKLFARAYTEWFSTSGYDRFPGPDLSVYGMTDGGKYYVEAWIPVVKA